MRINHEIFGRRALPRRSLSQIEAISSGRCTEAETKPTLPPARCVVQASLSQCAFFAAIPRGSLSFRPTGEILREFFICPAADCHFFLKPSDNFFARQVNSGAVNAFSFDWPQSI